jgi:RHS repeat-associated protein
MSISESQGVQDYKFTGKELDMMNGLNLYDFEARTYDPAVGRFLSVDPMAEKYYHISPYAYCSNNPVNRIDPNGMDDYSINLKGKIELIKETKDEMDRLIALGKNDKIEYDDDGNMTNASLGVNKGILDNQKKSGGITYMSVKGNEQAEGMFKFLSENTTVEWGRVAYGNTSNYITTEKNAMRNGAMQIAYEKLFSVKKGNLVTLIDHSHPNLESQNGRIDPLPSGYLETPVRKGTTGDKGVAEWLYKYYPQFAPNIRLRVYRTNGEGYIRYDNKKIYYK